MSPSYSLHHLIAVALITSGASAVGVHFLTKSEPDPEPKRHTVLSKRSEPKSDRTSVAPTSLTSHVATDPEPTAEPAHANDPNPEFDSDELGADALAADERNADLILETSERGQSLSDSLTHLEAEYKAMLARTDRMEEELLTLKIDRLEKQIQEASSAALAAQDSAALARSQQTSAQGSWLSAENDTTTASAPSNANPGSATQTTTYAAQTTSSDEPDTNNTINQTNQTVVYSYVPIVVGTGRLANNQTNSNQGQTANGYASDRSLYQMGMQQQRAIRSPLSAQSTLLGTPLSPWAPIDMSKHHNPWGSSVFP